MSAILFELSANKRNKINSKICPWMSSWKLAPGFVHSMLVPSLPKPACPKTQDQVMPPQFHRLMHGLSQLSERGCITQMQVRPDSAMMLRYSIIQNPNAQGRSTGGQQKRFPMHSHAEISQHPPVGLSAATPRYVLKPNLLSFSRATLRQKAVWILLNPELPCRVQRS